MLYYLFLVVWLVSCSSAQGLVEADTDTGTLEGAGPEAATNSLSEQQGPPADPAAGQTSIGTTLERETPSVDEDRVAEAQPSETGNAPAVSPPTAEETGTANQGLAQAPPQKEAWEEDGIREEFGEDYTRVVFSEILSDEGYKNYYLQDPPRLVIDVTEPNREVWFNRLPLKGAAFKGIRVGRHPNKIRFVLDLRKEGQPEPLVQVEEKDVIVLAGVLPEIDRTSSRTATEEELAEFPVDMSAEAVSESATAPIPMGGPDVPLTVARADWNPVRVRKIDFLQTETTSDVIISTDSSVTFDVQEKDHSIVLVLPGAQIPDHLQRPIDTQAFPSAILSVKPEQVGAGPTGKVMFTIKLREKRPYNVLEQEKGVRVSILLPEEPPEMPLLPPPALPEGEGLPNAESEPAPEPEQAVAMEEAKPPAEPAPKAVPALMPKKKVATSPTTRPPSAQYRGKKISLDFKDADIQNVLRLIAEVSGRNIVISEAVKGKVTIRLLNVPWDMALDVILKTYALDKEELGPNILRIAPYTQLKREREDALKAEEALEKVEELQTRVVPVNYAKASDLENLLGRIKSKRPDATILVDSRTNALIIKDIASSIAQMIELVNRLDTQTPQVLIEAKIVELDVDFERELGIQWGTLYRAGPATGNPTGLNFPHTASVGGVIDNISGQVVPGVSNPVVNLPAAVDDSAGGALGFSLASITNSFRLDAQLSALEKRNHARILSSPRVATLNNQEAKINQGQEVPFQTTSDEGTKTEFKDAKLQLSVTPQITFDRSIIMSIVVTNDTPIRDPTVGFIIGTKEAKTSVLVKDGDTAVIGGIYTNNQAESVGGVPYLMDIPVAGSLFKKKGETDKRTELIIFITPRIIPTQLIGEGELVEQTKQE